MKLQQAMQKMMSAWGHLVALVTVPSVLPLGEKSILESFWLKANRHTFPCEWKMPNRIIHVVITSSNWICDADLDD
jgi:hypothetical protein